MSAYETFCEENEVHTNEGSSGLKGLEKAMQECGYTSDNFAHGSVTENFLKDNPGAIEMLHTFIEENFREVFDDWNDEEE